MHHQKADFLSDFLSELVAITPKCTPPMYRWTPYNQTAALSIRLMKCIVETRATSPRASPYS